MRTQIKIQTKTSMVLLFLMTILFGSTFLTRAANDNISTTNEIASQVPNFLLGTYEGTLINGSNITTDATCTIKAVRGNRYIISFNNDLLQSLGVNFTKNDDTYTSAIIIQGKRSFVTLDEDGDLSISTNRGTGTRISYNGELIRNNGNTVNDYYTDSQQEITSNNGNVHIQNGNQQISTSSNDDVYIRNGNQTIYSNDNQSDVTISTRGVRKRPGRRGNRVRTSNGNTRINNGNVSISTSGQNVSINTNGVNIGSHDTQVIEVYDGNHYDPYGNPYRYYNCNDTEIVELPQEVLGYYEGRLEGYGVNNRKGISRIIETGCKTYRLEFSDQIPAIHGVQFGRKNNFDEYTSLIVQGQYSAAIEIDTTFNDLDIDGDLLPIKFNGDKD